MECKSLQCTINICIIPPRCSPLSFSISMSPSSFLYSVALTPSLFLCIGLNHPVWSDLSSNTLVVQPKENHIPLFIFISANTYFYSKHSQVYSLYPENGNHSIVKQVQVRLRIRYWYKESNLTKIPKDMICRFNKIFKNI